MIEIVGVHGIRNLRRDVPADHVVAERSTRWGSALAAGLECPPELLRMTYCYYAPLLAARDIAQSDEMLDHLPDDAQEMILAWVAELGAPPAVAQGRLTRPIRQAADWVSGQYPKMTRAVVAAVFWEVARYLRTPDGEQRTAVREEVARVIAERRPQIVVAHSLGTVVAYEALWAHRELTVDLLITLGSPLALDGAVFPRLQPRPVDGCGARPPGVRRWVNIADVGDPVAVPRKLGGRFTDVDSDWELAISQYSFHRERDYLSCPATCDAVRPYLRKA